MDSKKKNLNIMTKIQSRKGLFTGMTNKEIEYELTFMTLKEIKSIIIKDV